MFTGLPINPYWDTHFRFDALSEKTSKQIGNQSINNVLINTVAVALFTYGRHLDQQVYIDRAIELLENIPAENNNVIYRFNQVGFPSDKADQTQALIQLKHAYCDEKKCLLCGIGIKLLKQPE